ncbi:hypothetical protein [Maricaulis sp. CAU 1757]
MTEAACIAIRADGGGQIGLGHVMRCAALADALMARGARIAWLTATPAAMPETLRQRVEVVSLPDDRHEAEWLAETVSAVSASWLVGDWKVTPDAVLRAWPRSAPPIALVGGFTGAVEVALRVRQGLVETHEASGTPTLSGPDWILLPAGLKTAPQRDMNHPPERLLVSLGGTSTPVARRVEQALAACPAAERLTIERANPDGARDASHLTGLDRAMRRADLAILAGGTSLHEAAALGLPAISLPLADNQQARAADFTRLGLGLTLDPYADDFQDRLCAALTGLLEDEGVRQTMSDRGRALVDGRGAERLAEYLLEHRDRPARPESRT